jgi:hypothetical protein
MIIVDNASDPPAEVAESETWRTVILRVPDQPPNISRMWNIGIKKALSVAEPGPSRIAIICDDTVIPAGWFEAVTTAMTETGAVVGCSDPFNYMPHGAIRVKTEPDRALMERMPGPAWILDPASPVRPDETLAWWWGDTDVDWQARKAGGMVMVGGYLVPNLRPSENNLRPEIAEQAGQDGLTFGAKWGWTPW